MKKGISVVVFLLLLLGGQKFAWSDWPISLVHPKFYINPTIKLRLQTALNNNEPKAVKFKTMVDNQMAGANYWNFQYQDAALLYALTGNTSYATYAINNVDSMVAAEEARISSGQNASIAGDSYLEVGPIVSEVMLTYDWCYDRLTSSQRSRWINYTNQAVFNVWHPTTANWGGKIFTWSGWSINNPYNNYYYSFLMATMCVGIVTYGENVDAETWLDMFRNVKIENQLASAFLSDLQGGGSREGTAYGGAMRGLFSEYEYWKDSVGEDISVLAGNHTKTSLVNSLHFVVPTMNWRANVGDQARDSTGAMFDYDRIYALPLISFFRGERIGQIGQYFINRCSVQNYQQFYDYVYDFMYYDPNIPERNLNELSTVYFASGIGELYMRSGWDTGATWAHFMCGPLSESHAHMDIGDLQIYKNSWLAIDENFYSHSGLRQEPEAHNLVSLLKNGTTINQKGVRGGGSAPTLFALEDNQYITYAGLDMSNLYTTDVSHDSRQVIFLRPGCFVVCDRVNTLASANIQKKWLLNTPVDPMISGATATVQKSDAKLTLNSISPAGAAITKFSWNGVDSSEFSGGYQLQITDQPSTGVSLFLNLLYVDDAITSYITDDVSGMKGVLITLKNGDKASIRFYQNQEGGTVKITNSTGAVLYNNALSNTVTVPSVFADGTGLPGSDTTAPAVSVTAPASGATVSGTITVTATASDNVGVFGVQFLVDGNTVGSEDTSSPYSSSCNTTLLSNGQHTLSAVARDAVGNATTAAVTVTVNNPVDTIAPAVGMTAPSGGTTVTGTITVSATASDNVGVIGVQFLLDGSALETEDVSSPYSIMVNTRTISNGSHTLAARARDAFGNDTAAAGMVVTVNNTIACPTVTAGGGWINQGFTSQNGTFTATFDVTPSVANIDGLVGLSNGASNAYSGYACLVVFADDGTIKARNGGSYPASSVTFSAGVQYHVRMVVNITAHTYSVYVTPAGGSEQTVASNYAFRTEQAGVSSLNNWGGIIDGASGTLEVCNFAIGGDDTVAPVVAMTAPANGSTVTGTITVAATASDNVGVAGVQFLLDGNILEAEDTNSPYSISLNTLTIGNGIRTLSARARDLAGNTTTSSPITITVSNPVSNTINLFWRNYSSGEDVMWILDGTSYQDSNNLPNIADTQWKIKAVADFNADGKADLVWRNASSGQDVVWFLNGASYVDSASLPNIADANWDIVGAADFNSDNKNDLLWRNSSTGENVVWFLNGTTYASSSGLPQIADTSWKVVGTGDINGDAQTDILWRNQGSGADAGKNVVWFMNGSSYVDYAWLPQIADTNWQIGGTSDFNADNKLDILWRNYSTGENVVWLLNGVTYVNSSVLPTIADINWKIAGVAKVQ